MSKINIVHIFAPNVLAGAERVVLTGLNALVSEDIHLTIIIIKELRSPKHADDFAELLDKRINIIFINSAKALDINVIKELNLKLKNFENNNTVIHTHGYKALLILRLSKNTKNFHVVHTHHGNTSHTMKVKIYEWWAQKVMQNIDAVICVSTEMKKRLSTVIDQKKLIVIENMLSFQNAHSIREERKELKITQPIHLLYVGRLSPEKGILHFLTLFSRMELRENFQVHIVGDGPLKNEIENIVKDKNLLQVKLYGFLKDPSQHFKTSHALIMPSFTEGLPMTLIEALASGLPVLATNVGAISSLVKDKKNGLLLNQNDERTWNDALSYYLENAQEINLIALNESSQVENAYSVKNWVEKTMNLYRISLK